MKQIFQQRPMRLIFIANMISMAGSGMNMSAVTWYLLQRTHSEIPLGKLTVLQVIPALLLLPFSGVVIDREDRRHLIMGLDALRGVVVLLVAVVTLRGASTPGNFTPWRCWWLLASGCFGPRLAL